MRLEFLTFLHLSEIANLHSRVTVDNLHNSSYKVSTFSPSPSRYETYSSSSVACPGSTHALSITCFGFSPPLFPKRGIIHSSIRSNQVWIGLTVICQSLLVLRLQICNIKWCLLGIFNSYINTGIVSCKYMICHCWPDSKYWLQPPGLDWRHTNFEKNDICFCIFSFRITFYNKNKQMLNDRFHKAVCVPRENIQNDLIN